MKHPHHDLIVQWAADTSRVVQRMNFNTDKWEIDENPTWNPSYLYRIKPEPKPDVARSYVCDIDSLWPSRHGETPTLRLTFDGETGALKSAEVLK